MWRPGDFRKSDELTMGRMVARRAARRRLRAACRLPSVASGRKLLQRGRRGYGRTASARRGRPCSSRPRGNRFRALRGAGGLLPGMQRAPLLTVSRGVQALRLLPLLRSSAWTPMSIPTPTPTPAPTPTPTSVLNTSSSGSPSWTADQELEDAPAACCPAGPRACPSGCCSGHRVRCGPPLSDRLARRSLGPGAGASAGRSLSHG